MEYRIPPGVEAVEKIGRFYCGESTSAEYKNSIRKRLV